MNKMDAQIQTPTKQVNYTKESNKEHKNMLKEEILQVINENFTEMLLDEVNLNIQVALKKFQDKKNKEYEKTQKQMNEIIGALNTKMKQKTL
jgi:hypothetical protein